MTEAIKIFNDPDLVDKSKFFSQDTEKALKLENESVSAFSPGPIENSESIARQIQSPIYFDQETGKLKPAAFSHAFDSCGMSVNRLSFSNENELHKEAEKRASHIRETRDNSREYLGLITAQVATIRSIVDEDPSDRLFTVYDTALEESTSHADVYMIQPQKLENSVLSKKALKNQRRRKLQTAFSDLIKPSII